MPLTAPASRAASPGIATTSARVVIRDMCAAEGGKAGFRATAGRSAAPPAATAFPRHCPTSSMDHGWIIHGRSTGTTSGLRESTLITHGNPTRLDRGHETIDRSSKGCSIARYRFVDRQHRPPILFESRHRRGKQKIAAICTGPCGPGRIRQKSSETHGQISANGSSGGSRCGMSLPGQACKRRDGRLRCRTAQRRQSLNPACVSAGTSYHRSAKSHLRSAIWRGVLASRSNHAASGIADRASQPIGTRSIGQMVAGGGH
jgi:hypothetical protein